MEFILIKRSKGYGFLSFAINMAKYIGKYISKNLSSKYSQKKKKNLPQMHLKLLQKERLKKQTKQLVIWLVLKSLTELQKFQTNKGERKRNRKIYLYLEKDLYLKN